MKQTGDNAMMNQNQDDNFESVNDINNISSSTDGDVNQELDTSDLPTSLIITNVDSRVFSPCDLRVSQQHHHVYIFHF